MVFSQKSVLESPNYYIWPKNLWAIAFNFLIKNKILIEIKKKSFKVLA